MPTNRKYNTHIPAYNELKYKRLSHELDKLNSNRIKLRREREINLLNQEVIRFRLKKEYNREYQRLVRRKKVPTSMKISHPSEFFYETYRAFSLEIADKYKKTHRV